MSEMPMTQDWVLVPREPTEEMIAAGANAMDRNDGRSQMSADCYRAMIEAAPPAPGGWRTMDSAPKDGTRILYITRHRDIGHCHWSPGVNEDEIDCWWDNERDDEVCPRWWMPALLPAPGDEKGKGGENSAARRETHWPSGCIKPNACSRHKMCVYAMSADQCRHFGRDLSADIEDESAARRETPEPLPPAVEGQG